MSKGHAQADGYFEVVSNVAIVEVFNTMADIFAIRDGIHITHAFNHKGVLPEWLHPQPVALVTVDDSVLDYANQIRANLEQEDINVLCEFGDHSVGRKIKRSFELKIPNIVIIGEQEAKTGSLSIRRGKQIDIIEQNELVSSLKAKQGK